MCRDECPQSLGRIFSSENFSSHPSWCTERLELKWCGEWWWMVNVDPSGWFFFGKSPRAMLLRVTMSYASSASRGSGETKGRSGQCQWLSWFNLPRFVELLLLQASTFPFFPTEVLYYLQNKTCPSPQLNWSMLINEQLGWAFFYGQCAGENRKEESKRWNGNGSTGSTHDLAFFDILTAIHWDWSPGSVDYAKQWN